MKRKLLLLFALLVSTTMAWAGTITVYFSDSFGWGTVNIYYWVVSPDENDWPGTAITNVVTNDYGLIIYSAEIPDNVTGIVFNNGSLQTVDITEGIANGSAWYPTGEKDGNNRYLVDAFEYTPQWSSGDCTVTYTGGVLTISGTGAMADYDDASNRPWKTYASDITSISIGEGVTSIGAQAFYSCTGLASVNIPSSVKTIGTYAFYSCTGLASVNIPSSVTSIGANAFSVCTNLTSVTIWAPSLTNYGSSAFDNCNALTKIYVPTEAAVTTYKSGNWSEYSGLISAIPNTLTAHSADGAYWCTYYNGYSNADVDANTKVYTVSVSGTNAILNEIADGNIKAGEGVVLKSTQESITLTYNTTATTGDFSTNVLEGVDAATACEANANYTLAGEEGLGFYKYTGTSLAANKAYLPASAVPSSAREFYLFSLEDEMTTGVADVRGKKEDVRSGEYFNLNGQRISKPTKKGLYIVGGRKFLKN